MSSFRSKTNNRRENPTERVGWSLRVEKCDGFSFLPLWKCLFFYVCTDFIFPFEYEIIPFKTSQRLQSPIRVEYKLSISRSNSCMWQVPVWHPNAFQLSVRTPPCLLFIADPRSNQYCPCPHYRLVGFLFYPSWRLWLTSPLPWATGVWFPPQGAPVIHSGMAGSFFFLLSKRTGAINVWTRNLISYLLTYRFLKHSAFFVQFCFFNYAFHLKCLLKF